MSNTQQIIDVGTLPNDGTGDPMRTAFQKINNNSSNLFTTYVNSTVANTTSNTANQVIFTYPANAVNEGQFYLITTNTDTNDSQSIQLAAHVNANSSNVKFTGYSMTYFGNCVTTYNMDVNSGNLRILVTPLANDDMTHFVSYQIMFNEP